MTYLANVVEVMIASPSDVAEERAVIRTVLGEWNDLNAQRFGIALLPVGWESHAVPQMGGRPQQFINRDVLARCDILIAVFWTRLGSPTGEAPSGTVEEIREHMAAGKIAMVYFSNAPVRPDNVDEEQYRSLRAFRKESESTGLIETFDSSSDLRDKLFRHLTRIIPERFAPVRDASSGGGIVPVPVLNLSPEAKRLLLVASQDSHGYIMHLRVSGGPILQTNGQQLNSLNNPREQAKWESALRQLEEGGFIVPGNSKREFFKLSDTGYDLSDQLSQETNAPDNKEKHRRESA